MVKNHHHEADITRLGWIRETPTSSAWRSAIWFPSSTRCGPTPLSWRMLRSALR